MIDDLMIPSWIDGNRQKKEAEVRTPSATLTGYLQEVNFVTGTAVVRFDSFSSSDRDRLCDAVGQPVSILTRP